MGCTYSVTVKNETPYTWHYSDEERGRLSAWESKQFEKGRFNKSYLYLTYGDQREASFSSDFGCKGNITFTIKESWDRSLFELHCSICGEVRTCPNYAKIEEDRIRKQQQEEQKRQEALKRQQEEQKRQEALKRLQEEQKLIEELHRQEERLKRLEQEKRIEEQINREYETASRKLSEAFSKINLNLSQGEQERHHQHTHMVQKAVDDHLAAIEWDEVQYAVF